MIASFVGPWLSVRLGDRPTLIAVLGIQSLTQVLIFWASSFAAVAAALALAAFGIVVWNIVTVTMRRPSCRSDCWAVSTASTGSWPGA